MEILMHSHHEGPLFEPTYNPKERYDYIVNHKPAGEQHMRLALFAAIPDEVVASYFPSVEARQKYDEALQKSVEAWQKSVEAWQKYNEAWQKYDEARQKHDEAGQKCVEAGQKYDEAWQKYDEARQKCVEALALCDVERMHRELCWSWCPGEHIFAKGYDLMEVSGWR